MGNRAVITFHTNPAKPAVYVHWNGGLASVLGFLQAQRELFSWDDADVDTRTKQLHEVCAAYIGSSAYLEAELGCTDQDNWDNGTYVVDPVTLLIKRREYLENTPMGRRGAPEEVDQEKTDSIAQQCVQTVLAARCAPWFELQPVVAPKGRRAAVRAARGAGKARVQMARTDCLPWFHLEQDRITPQGLLMTPAAAALEQWAKDHLVVVHVGG